MGYFYTKIFQCTPLDMSSHFPMHPSKIEKQKRYTHVPNTNAYRCTYFQCETSLKALVSKNFSESSQSQSKLERWHLLLCVLLTIYRRDKELKHSLKINYYHINEERKKNSNRGHTFLKIFKGKWSFFELWETA